MVINSDLTGCIYFIFGGSNDANKAIDLMVANPRQEIIDRLTNQIQDKIEMRGLDFEDAVNAVKADMEAFRMPEENIALLEVAKGKYAASLEAVEYLKIPTIKRIKRKPWYSGPKDGDVNWPRFKKYLVDEKGWHKEIESIDQSSTKVVSMLDNPGLPEFSTRGLVVGYVQSGKTANMTSVIAKAADSNFRFFIILSGMSNALREQTQERIEDDLISRNPENWYPWTTRDEDFIGPQAGCFPQISPNQRQFAVIKKNKSRLERLLSTIIETDISILRNLPVMLIDDECDQASVNTSKYREDMTAINGLIREILKKLPRVSYIGYTATPFANVLIDPAYSVNDKNPDDLYPKDFITALPKADNYFGAEKLFGRDLLDADEVPPDERGLDMIRLVPDEEIALLRPSRIKDKDTFEPEMADSLSDAIKYFLMATAARLVRGDQEKHSSMLVHTTVYIEPHFKQRDSIKIFLELIKKLLSRKDSKFINSLAELWNKEQSKVDSKQLNLNEIKFSELALYLEEVIERVEIAVENSGSEERLDFKKVKNDDGSERGRIYIVVGGSVLARGLTIEGLVVSFFLRTSSQYDSLMQMGRWFGYRENYEDLPRVWMTSDMEEGFHDLALVEAEIRNDIEVYEREELTPLEFAVRIRQIPGLAITSKNKMLSSEDCAVSFSGEHRQTRIFKHLDKNWLNNNWSASVKLVKSSGDHGSGWVKSSQGHVNHDVPFKHVIDFLNEYRIHEKHEDILPERLIDYIHQQNEQSAGVLSKWNIGIVAPEDGTVSQQELGDIGKVRTLVRSRFRLLKNGDADIKALMSKSNIMIDMPSSGFDSKAKWGDLKLMRKGVNPLLLLYPIEAYSEPQRKSQREPLAAVCDVMGIGILFPKASISTPIGYTRVILPETEYEELDIPEEEL